MSPSRILYAASHWLLLVAYNMDLQERAKERTN